MRLRVLLTLATVGLALGAMSAQEPATANLRPVVSWVGTVTTPFAVNSAVTLEAAASDPDGSISRVVFWYLDAGRQRVIGQPTTAPYKAVWMPLSPGVYSIFALALDNKNLGQNSVAYTVVVGAPPLITSFSATPNGVVSPSNPVTLQWTAAGASTLTIDQGLGVVTGQSSRTVAPNAPPGTLKVYTLTASNAYGTATKTTDVTIGLPVINSFTSDQQTVTSQGATFTWSTTAARNVSITQVTGAVATSGSIKVYPASTKTQTSSIYTLTATNAAGSTTKTLNLAQMATLTRINDVLYYSEHVLFIIPAPNQVSWGPTSYDEVFSPANRDSYVTTLKQYFPDDYVYIPLIARNLSPNKVPSALTFRHLADGIGDVNVTGVGVPNFTRYPVSGTFIPSSLGVLTHEAGHNWGVRIGAEVGSGHWLARSTASGKMADVYSDDGFQTVKLISGNPAVGFTWGAVGNVARANTQTFNDQDLYLMGLNDTFPTVHVLNSPVYNADHTVSYASVANYDQAWVEQRWGVRSPSYRDSPKRLRAAFIYIARDLIEILSVAPAVEISAAQWTEGEQVDTVTFNQQMPFLVATKYRGSFDARLADLDGNVAPTLAIDGPPHVASTDGSASVPFVATDPDGSTPPAVSCLPASAHCAVVGNAVTLSGLAPGAHFVTIKAQDPGGKKTFAHFVVDVEP